MNDIFKIDSIINEAFGNNVELFPSVNELFELELAHLEYRSLSGEQLLERTAYIKSVDNKFSNHYLLYSNNSEKIHVDRTSATQAYFEEGKFSTGYATHGLFPYRGKFHPQLIKGLINILNVQKGGMRLEETVINSAKKYEMPLVKSILKPIKGMRNAMKEEYNYAA